jgi:hypothetical protein
MQESVFHGPFDFFNRGMVCTIVRIQIALAKGIPDDIHSYRRRMHKVAGIISVISQLIHHDLIGWKIIGPRMILDELIANQRCFYYVDFYQSILEMSLGLTVR